MVNDAATSALPRRLENPDALFVRAGDVICGMVETFRVGQSRQMGPTFQLLAELEPHTPVLRVLLTQVHARTVASRVARDLLAQVEVPLLEGSAPPPELPHCLRRDTGN